MAARAWVCLLLAWSCAGCAGLGYTGAARDLSSDAVERERGWKAVRGVPLYRQATPHDCGPTALAMVLHYWDAELDLASLHAGPANQRASAADLRRLAREAGFNAFVVEGRVEDLAHEIAAGRPVIVGVAKPTVEGRVAHYEVVVGFHPQSKRIATLDPAEGWRQNSYEGFLDEWVATGQVLIVVMPRESAAPRAGMHGSPTAARTTSSMFSTRTRSQ